MKYKDIAQFGNDEQNKKLAEMKKELMKLRAQVASGTTSEKPGHIRSLRRNIARIKTAQQTKRT